MSHSVDELPRRKADQFRDSAWQSQVARPVLIALQVTCLLTGLWLAAQIVTEEPALRFGPLLIFVAALVGVYSAQWLAEPAQRLTNKTSFMLAELVVVLLVVRLLTWALTASWPTLAVARGWILEPWRFFDLFFLAMALLGALAWHRGFVVGGIFHGLALTSGELAVDKERRAGVRRYGQAGERVAVPRQDLAESYVSQWLLGAFFLLFFAAVTRVQRQEDGGLSLLATGMPPVIVAACVFYFLIGLVLTSQARLAVLRGLWLQDGVDVPENLPGRWHRFSLGIILAIGLLATLLPLGSTWQVGEILSILLGFLVSVVMFFVFLFVALTSLILSLFRGPQPMPELPQQLTQAPAPVPLPEFALPPWLGGVSLWIAVAIVVLLSLRFLVGEEGLALTLAKLRHWAGRLKALLRSWWDEVRGLARAVQSSLPGRFGAPAPPAGNAKPWRFIRLSALPAREQVRYFYLSAVRRAAEQGVARRPSQTPSEFIADLENHWPEAEVDVQALTEAFVTARYDAADITSTEAKSVQTVWERLKRALRARRRPT